MNLYRSIPGPHFFDSSYEDCLPYIVPFPGELLSDRIKRALLQGVQLEADSAPLYDDDGDDPENFDVDPACDIRRDTFSLAEDQQYEHERVTSRLMTEKADAQSVISVPEPSGEVSTLASDNQQKEGVADL